MDKKPSVFTRSSAYIPWIENIIRKDIYNGLGVNQAGQNWPIVFFLKKLKCIHSICCLLSTLFLPCVASGCGGPEVLNGTGGTVSSMGFPGSYNNNAKCHWIIHAPPGKLVHLHFHNFSLEESQLCMNDRLRIADGTGALGL